MSADTAQDHRPGARSRARDRCGRPGSPPPDGLDRDSRREAQEEAQGDQVQQEPGADQGQPADRGLPVARARRCRRRVRATPGSRWPSIGSGDDLGGLRDRRGRQGAVAQEAVPQGRPARLRRVQSAIPQGLARLDQLGRGVARRCAPVRLAFGREQLPKCASTPAAAGNAKPTRSSSGGADGDRDGDDSAASATLDWGSRAAATGSSVAITSDECNHFDAPDMPDRRRRGRRAPTARLQGLAVGRQGQETC